MAETVEPTARGVHVVWSLDERTGGLARAVWLVVAAQVRAGLDVVVLTTGETTRSQVVDGVGVHTFARGRVQSRFAGSPGLRRWLRDQLASRDTVHVHGVWDLTATAGAWAARRAGCRLVVSPHGSLEPFDLRKHARAKRLVGPLVVRPVLARATVHCTTEREAACLVTYGAAPEVRVVPLPLGEVLPAAAGRPGADFRAAQSIDPVVPLLLFLGRVDYKKGLGHLLAALRAMSTPAHLVVVGSGTPSFEAEVRSLAVELGVAHRVTWCGWLDGPDKAAAYRAADLFVLLSDAENYGIAVVEAMQHGAVVVASSEVGSAAELAQHHGVLVVSREPGEAAAALDRILADEDLRRRTAAAAEATLAGVLSHAVLDEQYERLARGGEAVARPRR